MRVARALVSVSDKTGLEELRPRPRGRSASTIVSTGGTADGAARAGASTWCRSTRSPATRRSWAGASRRCTRKVHGGILGRAGHAGRRRARCDEARHRADRPGGREPLPLRGDASRRRGVADDEIVEQIDIGGPGDDPRRREEPRPRGRGDLARPVRRGPRRAARPATASCRRTLRRRLAGAAFQRTAALRRRDRRTDFAEPGEDEFPDGDPHGLRASTLELQLRREPAPARRLLRRARRAHATCSRGPSSSTARSSRSTTCSTSTPARGAAAEFELPACVIVKHNNPCGVAVAGDVRHRLRARPRLRPGLGATAA